MNILRISQNGRSQMGYTEADGPWCVALQFDDLIGTLYDLLVEFVPFFRIVFGTDSGIDFTQTDARYINAWPYGN